MIKKFVFVFPNFTDLLRWSGLQWLKLYYDVFAGVENFLKLQSSYIQFLLVFKK